MRGANVDRPLDSGTALREGADPLNERPSAPTSRQAASLPCSRCKFCCVHALLPRVHALLLPRVSLRAIICHLPLRACGTLRWRPVLCCSHALLLPHSCTATYSVLSLCVKEQWPTRVVPPRACVFCCSHVFCNRPSCHTAGAASMLFPHHAVALCVHLSQIVLHARLRTQCSPLRVQEQWPTRTGTRALASFQECPSANNKPARLHPPLPPFIPSLCREHALRAMLCACRALSGPPSCTLC